MKKYIRILVLVVLVASAGCSALQNRSVSATAQPAELKSSIASSHGLTNEQTQSFNLKKKVTVLNKTYSVHISNYLTTYKKIDASNETLGMFIVFSSPSVKIAGQPSNPLLHLPDKELLKHVGGRVTGLNNISRIGSYEVQLLGSTETTEIFTAVENVGGRSISVKVHYAKTSHEGDTVVAAYIHRSGSVSLETARSLFEGVVHNSTQ